MKKKKEKVSKTGRTKSQSSRLARQRGAGYEREVSKELRMTMLFPYAQRRLEYQTHKAKGHDIDYTGEFLFQCKRGRNYHGPSALDEIHDRTGKKLKVLVTKADNKESMAIMSFEQFKDVMRLLKDSHPHLFELTDDDKEELGLHAW
jgi:hypothetical protein